MKKKPLSGRALKRKVYQCLESADYERALQDICSLPGQQVINPLFSFLYDRSQDVKWAAVRAMGAIVAKMAEEDMESARVIMRRLMWNLNDESGGIGWGSPEAMGEILANHEGLAKEYAPIMISYTMPNGNYLEHEILQRGLLWGIGRLVQVRPHLMKKAAQHLLPYLDSPDATVRGLASRAAGLLKLHEARPKLKSLSGDKNEIQIYKDHKVVNCLVMDLAEEALKGLGDREKSK